MSSQVPINTKLWNLTVLQAKARFSKYPSPAASHWVHSEYVKRGGRFEEVSATTRQEKQAKRHFEEKKREKLQAKTQREKESDHKN